MFLTNLVYLFHIVFHCILLFVSVAHRDLTVYALINMALLLLLLLLSLQYFSSKEYLDVTVSGRENAVLKRFMFLLILVDCIFPGEWKDIDKYKEAYLHAIKATYV